MVGWLTKFEVGRVGSANYRRRPIHEISAK